MSSPPPAVSSSPPEALKTRFSEGLAHHVPHNRALGIRFSDYHEGSVTLELPYDARLAASPETGVLHGGAITSLMDATCGTAVFVKLPEPAPIATLDLRIDYLRPATPEKSVLAKAHCFKVTRNVAFVRCEAFHADDPADLIAVANGTFMIFRGKAAGGGA